jgi:UDP-N-acetylglucosamine--N-acetylmuramyl-(pentapeptide) pyrophosphoryl-undecaprenol N-acetylglucosamine transferase
MERPPDAVLAMGGFTAAPPVLAARRLGACAFLHESNAVPGRANRWLSWMVCRAFVGFPSAAAGLHNRRVTVSGTPVREQFQRQDAAKCRLALGLAPDKPVVLVMGGSQGAAALNELLIASLGAFASRAPDLQWVHLSGPAGEAQAKRAFANSGLKAAVYAFLPQMELALGAATVALSRAGASSLAELAAMRLPAILVPYPTAADNHQFHNARAFEATGAAWLLDQRSASPDTLARMVLDLVRAPQSLARMQAALERWHTPAAAAQIADEILNTLHQSRTIAGEADRSWWTGRPGRRRSHLGTQGRMDSCLASRRVA